MEPSLFVSGVRRQAGARSTRSECLLPRAAAIDPARGGLLVACLGIDAVLADSPSKMAAVRDGIALPLQCARAGTTGRQ